MAEIKIDGRMKVKSLKEQFFNEYGGVLRVYAGRSKAQDDASLASIRANDAAKGGELVCQGNRTVGKFEKEMWDVFGIKVQVATKDDSILALDGITLAKLKDIPERATKEIMEQMELYDVEIHCLRSNRFNSTVIVNRKTGDILTWLRSVLCTNEDEVLTVFDGRELTDKHLLCKKLEEVPKGYIIFTHLSEIPDSNDADIIKQIIRICIKCDWRMDDIIFAGEDWMNALSQKSQSIGVIVISEQDEYKTSRDFRMMTRFGACSWIAITDNGFELIE